ncbi:hypothetical protein ACTA71_011739 [Dictyostelium dimigraforme]
MIIQPLKVTKNQQFSFTGNDFNIGVKMSITVSNYTYSNQSNYLVVAIQSKAESDSSATSQNKCNDGTIEIKSQSNSNWMVQILNIEPNYKNASSCIPLPNSESQQPSTSLKGSSISFNFDFFFI